ncbi:MAG: hypothetical protein QOG53_751 [Frankiales bacterium]|jgi:uncharacterized HhH-GPD family protein|nr:hypothetical protein [Frankiales bacterium]
MAKTQMKLHLATTDEANNLLARDPFSLLTGMLLDQQVPMEWAFTGPYTLAQRLGSDRLDPAEVATYDPDKFVALASQRPAIHRYPGSMGKRIQALAQHIVDNYGGDAEAIWTGAAGGPELLTRLKALPGFGEQKAKIFLALLGKQLGVQPEGWREAASVYGEEGSTRSIADVTSTEALAAVRAYKQRVKAKAKQAAR